MGKNIENIIYKDINSLISAEYNPRQLNKEQYNNIKDSLKRFGFVDPVIVNKNKDRKNIIIGGHQRVKVAKDLKIDKVPCVELDLDIDKEKELNIRLNKNVGEWDFDILADLFDIDELIEWGFKEEELVGFDIEEEKEGLTDDDDIPEDVEPVCKLGDIWQLGNHRLLCGDSTKKENIELLLDGNKADMVFTDPPYGMDLDADYSKLGNNKIKAGRKHKNIINDDKAFNPKIIFEKFDYCKDIVLFGADYYSDLIPNKKNGSWLVWDKRVEDRYDKIIGSAFEMIFSKRKIKREILRYEYVSWANRMKDKLDNKKPHPTMKPVDMLVIILKKFKKNFIVDIFLGSGSTLIACEKTNRVCYGMELDEKYCDVIINRWEQFTGNKAELINEKRK